MLMPARHGNEARLFLDQDSYELTIANKYVLPNMFTYSVWATSTDALTARGWPKIKLPEGVQQVTGTRFTYNPMPTTQVPKRGTVRFMSKQTSSFSLQITQKGIGSTFEGSALDSAFGPQLVAMEIRAYAESVNLGMAINTAINMVNTAYRLPFLQNGYTFGRNLAQEMSRELGLWASIGTGPNRIFNEIEEILREAPELDTLYIPDRARQYIKHGGLGREVPITLYSINKQNDMVITESPDRLMSAATLFDGRVDAFDMPQFRIKTTGKAFQPLETINVIGEVYFMHPEDNPLVPGQFSSRSLDLYLYDQPKDHFTKITMLEAIRHSQLWRTTRAAPNEKVNGYHERLNGYFERLVRQAADKPDKSAIITQFPISLDRATGKFYLPFLWGNLDPRFQDSDAIHDAVESVNKQLTYGAHGGKILLSEANEELKNLDRLREAIENAPYNADYWAEVARLNIGRSVSEGANGNPTFVGEPTPIYRTESFGGPSIAEWSPNPYGGLDVPTDVKRFGNPAGMWSAAGLKTLANLPEHPLYESANRAYNYLSTIADQLSTILRASAIWSHAEMPPNFHSNDTVQLLMTAIWGPRVPVFLAAPMNLTSETPSKRVAEATPMTKTKVVRVMGIDLAAFDMKTLQRANITLQTGSLDQGEVNAGSNLVFWKTPSGVRIHVPAELLIAAPKPPSAGPTADLVVRSLYPDSIEALDAIFAADEKPLFASFVNALYSWIAKEYKSNPADLQVSTKIVAYLSSLGRENKDAEVKAAVALLANPKSRTGPTKAAWEKLNEQINAYGIKGGDEQADVDSIFFNPPQQWRPNAPRLTALNEQYAKLAQNVETIVAARRAADPSYDPTKAYIVFKRGTARLPTDRNIVEFDAGLDDTMPGVADYQETIEAIRQALENLGENKSTSFLFVDDVLANREADQPQQGSSLGRVNVGDVATSTRYRAPLNMSWVQLQGALRVTVPWILPADMDSAGLSQPIKLGTSAQNLQDHQWQIPHYLHSRNHTPQTVNKWHDAGVFARVGLVSGAYGSAGRSGARSKPSSTILSAGGLIDRQTRDAMSHVEDAMDIDGDIGPVPRPTNVGPGPIGKDVPVNPLFARALEGPMAHNVAVAVARYSTQIVHRAIALAYLNTPIEQFSSVHDLVLHNVCLPFESWAWRLNSRTVMGSFLFMKAGLDSGANFYNGAKFTVGQDAVTDMWQTRVVLSTDAHPIEPKNHRLLRNVQPRSYAFGHDCSIITGPEDFTKPVNTRGSILFTICPRNSHKGTRSPLSFINRVPGQIMGPGGDALDRDQQAQNFPSAGYYGYYVYADQFFETQTIVDYTSAPILEKLVFLQDNKTNNHLAFNGFNIRYNYQTNSYNREVVGNGHRAARKFNYPGAKAYLNGEGDILAEPSTPIGQYDLY